MPAIAKSPNTPQLSHPDVFADRHNGPCEREVGEMLKVVGYPSLDALADAALPPQIRASRPLDLPLPASEDEALAELKGIAAQNQVWRTYIGCGWHSAFTPPVILRNILENPGWYTQYTPYQAEISQGRLEALLNFQTLVADLTGLEVANASLLDEATAAAEAMAMCRAVKGGDAFFVAGNCHPQVIEVVKTRAKPLGLRVAVGSPGAFKPEKGLFGALIQYPGTDGLLPDVEGFCAKARQAGALAVVSADPLMLTLVKSPGELGADIAVGSMQRFGLPTGFGGPSVGYMAVKPAYLRQMPGRLVGVSKDSRGKRALRLAVQTREQHIRREKATSNICTSSVLAAVAASMYAVYHGPEGLRRIASRIHLLARTLALGFKKLDYGEPAGAFFDTLRVKTGKGAAEAILAAGQTRRINFRDFGDGFLGVALGEKTGPRDIADILSCFAIGHTKPVVEDLAAEVEQTGAFALPEGLRRKSAVLAQAVFNTHRTETEMLRYIKKLEGRDLSLTTSMIPLGSCTMKLNAAAEMLPVTWPEFANLHPFVPADQAKGYKTLFDQLERWLCEITGFDAVSLQPNAGSQGEFTGLLVIRKRHESRGEGRRSVCLIPQSAHGTNPASAAMAGMRVVGVACDSEGNIDLSDLKAKAAEHAGDLAALMVTYPSTHGVFEEDIREICEAVHANGGQVYMDGANLNAVVGLCRPAELGADVCHLNLHKTFAMPHGGGGPGMGPIAVKKHLAPFLPGRGKDAIGPVSAAPWGSASLLPISWLYIRMMGAQGLERATKLAILNANYVAKRLAGDFPVVFKGKRGLVAHECILDLRQYKGTSGVQVEDAAKRLMDYGFHAPTVSFPVPGTLMVEPTESESMEELDRFCEAMASIRREIRDIEEGKLPREDNPLHNAPHTADQAASNEWKHPYSREAAVYPAPWLKERKFWPPVSRIDNPYGDRNLLCVCPPVEES
ncbi:MAG: aminomethyl-transferring glycine dehydrogenase [Elusimicrobia bacterium]|nr:aminomethyl-transferring glycine dehydrogenase [Elusimicrobiota bacterium]